MLSLVGIFGSLLFAPFAKLLPLRPLYLVIEAAGALFTASLLLHFVRPPQPVLSQLSS